MAELPDARFQAVRNFTKTLHHSLTAETDPKLVTLPQGFSVCIIGASTGIGEHIAYAFAHAKASTITIASRNEPALAPVAETIKSVSPNTTVSTHPCDISSYDSVSALATSVSQNTAGLDCMISVPASSPPFSSDITQDDPFANAQAFLTNTVGLLNAAKAFIPLLLQKQNGAKALLTISSLGATLTTGFAAQTAYNTSKLAQIRLIEYLATQFPHDKTGLLALAIHPGAVLTRMSKRYCPERYWGMLEDEVGLCGGVCVWVVRQTGGLGWLSGRFLSSNWDVKEVLGRRGEIVEGDKLKIAMVV